MVDKRTCEHPQERIEVVELDPLDDGTPVLRATCAGCGKAVTEPLGVTYAPRPVEVGGRWLPLVRERGALAVCAWCGRPLFPGLHPAPLVLFCGDETGGAVGEVNVCRWCEVADDLVEVLARVFGPAEEGAAGR